jgi:RNA polymerase sigma factor (sigma-70 family)
LEQLCRTYWYPIYAFIRRRGYQVHQAEDFTQSFFERLLSKKSFALADPSRGRFRCFLLTSLRNFLADEHARTQAEKRGGNRTIVSMDTALAEKRYAQEPRDEVNPEVLFEREWALTLLDQARVRLQAEYRATGKADLDRLLRKRESGEDGALGYFEIGARLGMSESAVNTAAMRWRRRYQKLIRDEATTTVAVPSETDEEIRYLLRVLSQ